MKKLLLFLALAAAGLQGWADEYYLVGGCTDSGWNAGEWQRSAVRAYTADGTTWVWAGKLTTGSGDDGRFKIPNGTGEWHAGYWAPSQGTVLTSEWSGMDDNGDSNDYKWCVSEEGYYLITFKTDTKQIKAEKLTAPSKDDDDYYLINSVSDYYYFAAYIATDDTKNAKARLTADLSFEGKTFVPMASDKHKFCGEFDGNGHTIDYAVVNVSYRFIGLFTYVTGKDDKTANIHDLIMGEHCSFTGSVKVGGIAGFARDGGEVKLTNIVNKANVTSTGGENGNEGNTAGLIACATDGTKITALNCANTGEVHGQDGQCAAFAGWTQSGTSFTNCWNIGDIYNMDNHQNLYRKPGDATITVTNCYDANGADFYTQGTKIARSTVATGELCYKLNGSSNGVTRWYQTFNTGDTGDGDAIPYPFDGGGIHEKVYHHATAKKCNGTAVATGGYNNSEDDDTLPHEYDDGWCSVCDNYQANAFTATDGWFEVATAKQLRWMAESVNEHNSTYGKANIKLTADIDYSAFTDQAAMFGKPSNTYKGIFDGQFHTVTVAFNNTTAEETGLFRRINSGTVKNLKVDGTITTNQKLAGGICSGIWDYGTIMNCESAVTITDEGTGDATHGGILAKTDNPKNIQILNCLFSGTLNAPDRTGNGGILGWPSDATDHQVTVKNCLVTGTITVKDDNKNDVIVRNFADTYNNYFTCTLTNNLRNSKNATQMDASTKTTGELCYKLNGSTQGGTDWYQNLTGTTDAQPTPFSSHAKVYATSTLRCDGAPTGVASYGNDSASATSIPDHTNVNGWCSVCNTLDKGYITPDGEGYYSIGSVNDLRWFAALVEDGGWSSNAKLTSDIFTYTGPYIGNTESTSFKGIFDGQGHKITVDFDGSSTNDSKISLFRCVRKGTIQNLVVDGSIKAGTGHLMGGLVNESREASTYRNIVVGVNMQTNHSGDGTHGGIISVAWDTPTVENVAFVGEINAPNDYGSCGMIGYAHSGNSIHYKNCYVSGTLTLTGDNNRVFGRNGEYCDNCYTTLDMTKLNNAERFTGSDVTSTQVASGELCYLLNGSSCYDAKWFQNLTGTTDSYPVPFNTHGIVNKISSVGYTTQYIPSTDVTIPEGVEAYAGEINGEKLCLTEITGSINKEDAVILKGTANEYYSFVPTSGAVKQTNDLLGSDGTVDGGSTIYALANLDDAVGFYQTGNYKIPAGKAYLAVTTGPGEVKGFTFVFDDDATGLDAVNGEGFMVNGPIFNLAGQRIQKMQKGINIVNGKKVMVK